MSASNDANLQKIRFYLPQEDEDGARWPPCESEGIWAFALGDGLFRVDNVPFYAYGVNIDDIVRAEERGADVPVVAEVVRRSGHSTYRIWMEDEAASNEMLAILKQGGCYIERADEQLAAIDIPPGPDAELLRRLIFAAREEGVWDVDEGYWAGTATQQLN
jgi:hypothetical protein